MKLGYSSQTVQNFFKVIYFHQILKACTVFNATGYSVQFVMKQASFITNCTEHRVSSQIVQNFFQSYLFLSDFLNFCTVFNATGYSVQFVMNLGYSSQTVQNFFKVIYFHQIQKACTVFNATGYSIQFMMKQGYPGYPDRWQSKTFILSTNVDQKG